MESKDVFDFIKIQKKINRQHNVNFTLLSVYILLISAILLVLTLRINGAI